MGEYDVFELIGGHPSLYGYAGATDDFAAWVAQHMYSEYVAGGLVGDDLA
jgi:hypothetical protein